MAESSTKDSGSGAQSADMAKGGRSFLMGPFTKAGGKEIGRMAREGSFMSMARFMKGNGRMTPHMEEVSTRTWMAQNMTVIGK